jgi:hypothetical protein
MHFVIRNIFIFPFLKCESYKDEISVTDPDHFDTDSNPTFSYDTTQDTT